MLPVRDAALPFWIPARFLLSGALALPATFTFLALQPGRLLGHHAAPAVLAAVHGITLLFGAMIFVGALQQLAPVMLRTPLRSLRLARWSFPPLLAGGLGVVGGFALGYRPLLLAAGGALVVAALALTSANLIATAARAPARDAVGTALVASAVYLLLAALMGTLLALSRRVPALAGLAHALPLHLGLGLFGAFFLGIASAGHKLLGMFVL